jgi:hypothetical protein
MIIDETTLNCPFRVFKEKGKLSRTLSDHNTITTQFEVPKVKSLKEDEAVPKWIIKPENFPNLEQNFAEEQK